MLCFPDFPQLPLNFDKHFRERFSFQGLAHLNSIKLNNNLLIPGNYRYVAFMTADTAHVFILCETNCRVQTRGAAKQSVPVCVTLQGVTFRGLGLFGVRLSRLRSLSV